MASSRGVQPFQIKKGGLLMVDFLLNLLINGVCIGMIGLLIAFIIDHFLVTKKPHRHR